jgi:hypothetical protein
MYKGADYRERDLKEQITLVMVMERYSQPAFQLAFTVDPGIIHQRGGQISFVEASMLSATRWTGVRVDGSTEL